MQLDSADLGPTRKEVTITVPARRVDSSFSMAYNRLSQRVNLPGFRKGKVPMGHLRKRFGKEATADVTQALVEEGWAKILDDLAIVPVGMPDIDAELAEQGKDFVFKIAVEVTPTVELQPYDGLKIEKDTWTVGDAPIDHELEHLREHAATFVPVEGRDEAAEGDMAVIDYAGSIDGVAFPGGTAEGADLVLGSGNFIPGFEDQIVGKKVGSSFDVEVTFPEDYGAEDLAGKAAVFAVTLHELKAKELPELGDALAERLGVESYDKLREEVSQQISQRYERQAVEEARKALRAALSGQYDFAVPETMVTEALDERRGQVLSELMSGGTDYEAAAAKVDEALEAQRAEVENDVRVDLVLDEIAAKEEIEVEVHEVNAFIERMVRSMGQYGGRMRQVYKDSNRRAALQRRLRQDKVLDFLLDKAEVSSVEREVPAHLDHDHG